jgi:hypothetical protein
VKPLVSGALDRIERKTERQIPAFVLDTVQV